jgi:hypothetical protein
MLTAKDLARVFAVLKQVEALTMKTANDPAVIGNLTAEAFIASLPIRHALEDLRVEIQPSPATCTTE